MKTDQRDVAALADACRLGIFRPAHRRSAAHRRLRRQLKIRDHVVRLPTKTINLVRAQLRAEGIRVRPGMSETFAARVRQTPVPVEIAQDVSSALRLLNILNVIIRRAELPLLQRARDTAAARRLMTVPGVGPITALTFVATIDSPDRFRSAAPVTSFLGLVPIEYSSGEQQRKGPISRAGDTRRVLCWCRRLGPCCERATQASHDCESGCWRWRAGEVAVSPSWDWPDDWLAFSLRSGVMRRCLTADGWSRFRCRHDSRH